MSGPGLECNLADVTPGRAAPLSGAGTLSPALKEGFRVPFNEAALDLQGLQRRIKRPRENGTVPPVEPGHVSKMWEHWTKQGRRTPMLGPFKVITL